VVLEETLVEIATVPETVAPDAGEVIEILGAEELLTAKVTVALVAVWPAELEATAAREWLPLVSVVVFREKANGAAVTAAPELTPSTLNCTLVVLEETLVEIATVPETVAPDAGEVIEMVGAEELLTVMVIVALVAVWPAELEATAAREWLPLVSVVVFKEKPNGAAVTAAPELTPSTLNCTMVVLEETLVETATVPETVAPDAGEVIEMVGAEELLTEMVTVALVAVWPAELEATAAREWLPLVSAAVFREKPNGALVTAAPELAPSTLNCTLVVLEETLVETATVPETVAPDAGEVIEIVGAEELLTTTMTVALVAVWPAEFLAMAASEWLPLVSVVVFKEKLKGALVIAAPKLLPSTLNCTLVVLEEALAETGNVPETVAPETGETIETDGAVELLTVIKTVPLVSERPFEVVATAASEWLPLVSVAVFREKLNGALVTAAPASLPSTLNCTLAVLEETLVVTAMVPETVAPGSGEVIEIVGGRLLILIEEGALVTVFPDELVAAADRVKVPSDNLVVSIE
jgi:hypothetical protein